MKKNLVAYLLLSLLAQEGFASEKFTEGFEFLPSEVNTNDSISDISIFGEKMIVTRNDSAIALQTDSASFDLVLSDSTKIDRRMMRQCTYDTTSGLFVYSANGKLYSVNLKAEKRQTAKALIIDGVTNVRQDFENSSIANHNWRYKERDTIRIFHPTLANNGKRIYFSAQIDGGLGGRDIWFIDKVEGKNNKWGKPQNISKIGLTAGDTLTKPTNGINSANDEDYPFLANDSTIYFSSDRKAKFKGWNLYSASIAQGEKANLLPDEINSDGDDKAIVLTDRSTHVLSNRRGTDWLFSPSRFVVNKSDEELLADANIEEPKEVVLTKEANVYTLYFMLNTDVMIEDYDAEIDEIKEWIIASPKNRFTICGHADNTGKAAYNQKLSLKRAKSIFDILVRKGVNKKQLKYKGFGSTRPKDKDDLSKNRRVEIVLEGK